MFSEPDQNIKQFKLREDALVADFGAGAGWYSLAAARVATRGRVYAIDVQRDLLEKIKKDALQEHLLNVDIIWADIERPGGSKLADKSVDAVIIANVFFQVPDKKSVAAEADRILKAGSRVLVIDWLEGLPGGVPPVSKVAIQDLFYGRGFSLEGEISAGEHHYGLIFKKP